MTLLIIIWILLSIWLGFKGSERKIGGMSAFFLSLLLSPVIGFMAVALSDKIERKIETGPDWNKHWTQYPGKYKKGAGYKVMILAVIVGVVVLIIYLIVF